ncbi:MAG: hypothetical protein RBG13Loki_3807 [Promethearchaeota archaeon CR_4]|nr:MAG: hypothetical protein RBG13Loki_3807 [Candidatus Lokiarchaeota archaeon CR_4]
MLTQSCDIANAQTGDSIFFAELVTIEKKDFDQLSNKLKEKHIEKIIDTVRNHPRFHYFPEMVFTSGEGYGPWNMDFKTVFPVPTELITQNIDMFWKARILSEGLDVLKEKISRFFTRLAFEECIFLANNECECYIKTKRKGLEEEIRKVRKALGFDNPQPSGS